MSGLEGGFAEAEGGGAARGWGGRRVGGARTELPVVAVEGRRGGEDGAVGGPRGLGHPGGGVLRVPRVGGRGAAGVAAKGPGRE